MDRRPAWGRRLPCCHSCPASSRQLPAARRVARGSTRAWWESARARSRGPPSSLFLKERDQVAPEEEVLPAVALRGQAARLHELPQAADADAQDGGGLIRPVHG